MYLPCFLSIYSHVNVKYLWNSLVPIITYNSYNNSSSPVSLSFFSLSFEVTEKLQSPPSWRFSYLKTWRNSFAYDC